MKVFESTFSLFLGAVVAVQGVPQYFYAYPGTFPSFQPNGLKFSHTPQQFGHTPQQFGNIRHSAQEANCRIEMEPIAHQQCQTKIEQECETEEILVEEIEYLLKCHEVVDQACGQVVPQGGQFNPSAPQFRHRCHDLPRQVCLPEGQKKEVLKPVDKCWNVQKVECREVVENVPKNVCNHDLSDALNDNELDITRDGAIIEA
ncbi:hypothetical protein TCAL_05019 [Tigriopus californicus]|uniref:Uncharacterized protein n=1 Tax=Tigriopus californicus TaxID=6832 RepID=A0A553PBS8_TIGCA|nr:uncharacterized protein LOC131893402 [Tigriopus californicus]TRY75138.1 hypothetical protein TCAL_05019 [Tigriopus californicus]|eukprot:TCALIF_05019-PA protein Name:"Protein of unknown function" AED:0.00 eAED:0.00 QI:13/1/1/1/0.66/0.5/4/68/201